MSIQNQFNRNDYTGDGATVTFAYTNLIFASTDLQVYVSGTLKTVGTDYTVTGVGVVTGGNVVFTVAPANQAAVEILRVEPLTRTSNYVDNDPFAMSTLNKDLDKLTMICQQLQEQVGRAIGFATTSLFKNVTIPDLTGQAGFFLQVDVTAAKLQWAAQAVVSGVANPMTSVGDLITGGSSGTPTRLAVGANGNLLGVASGTPSYRTPTQARGDLSIDPVAKGDLFSATATSTPSRLAVGADRTILEAASAAGPGVQWIARALGLKSVQVFTASGTYTRPTGIRKILVQIVAGGGGGGGCGSAAAGSSAGGGGGGAGGCAFKLLDVTAIATSTITIGALGAGGTTGANSGSNGGTSSWADGTNTVSATGGVGGGGGAQATTGTGGTGGVGSGGDINLTGGGGGSGIGAGTIGTSGAGGNSIFGSGAPGAGQNTGGVAAAANSGAGGSGGTQSGTAGPTAAGGNGGSGIIIVWEYE